MTVRVRYAPSPTGPLHIGSARTVLYNWLFARQHGGKMILRSEDTDRERSDVKWEQEICQSLRWLGLDWDEGVDAGGDCGPYRQTQRLELYRDYIQRLEQQGRTYYCFCTPEDLEARRQQSRYEHGGYDGACRQLSAQEVARRLEQGESAAVRFRVPRDTKVEFNDLVRGDIAVETAEISDFVILKKDGIPTYNFAVVVDDVTMGISHVIRANEHLINTPRQILLYQALGEQPPAFAHISLILDKSGRKMSKRMGDTAVDAYAQKGYLPEAIVNYIALLGWSPEDEQEIFSLEELVAEFDMGRVSRSPAIFDVKKLDWMNNQYIMQTDTGRLADMAMEVLAGQGVEVARGREWLRQVIEVVRDELANLAQLAEFLPEFTEEEVEISPQAMESLTWEHSGLVLDQFISRLKQLDSLTSDSVGEMLKQLNKDIKKQTGSGGKTVFMPVRAALSGQTSGQELYLLVPLLGRELALKRIDFCRRAATDSGVNNE